jgi:Ca-activated chloride channel family protein
MSERHLIALWCALSTVSAMALAQDPRPSRSLVATSAATATRSLARQQQVEPQAPLGPDSGARGLPDPFREWLQTVRPLIGEREVAAFLELATDERRQAFIERFWQVRDPYPATPRNELRDRWVDSLSSARRLFGRIDDDRYFWHMLHGGPRARLEPRCSNVAPSLEVWYYLPDETVQAEHFLFFVASGASDDGDRLGLWTPADSIVPLTAGAKTAGTLPPEKTESTVSADDAAKATEDFLTDLRRCPGGVPVALALSLALADPAAYQLLLVKIASSGAPIVPDWTTTFAHAGSSTPPAGAETSRRPLTVQVPGGPVHTGPVRIIVETSSEEIVELRFALDGREVVRKRSAPYVIELDLGTTPRRHRLRVDAYDRAGALLAFEELTLNARHSTVDLRFVEPNPGDRYSGPVPVRLEATAPAGEIVQQVELRLDGRPVTTLYQPPFVHTVALEAPGKLSLLEAVATFSDAQEMHDRVLINVPGQLEQLEVRQVELYASVLDRAKRTVLELERSQITLLEDGVVQSISRLEKVDGLPMQLAVLLDTSASMVEDLPATRDAASRFFAAALTPRDRAALITFDDSPRVVVDFTNRSVALTAGLAGLEAQRGTALFDSLVFALYHLSGSRGQRAILLLSDGRDQSSRFTFRDALEYAHSSGVAIYAISIKRGRNAPAEELEWLARETGGAAFQVRSADQLPEIYDRILGELRTRYLIVYQSSDTSDSPDFRRIEIESPEGLEVRTSSGYYP